MSVKKQTGVIRIGCEAEATATLAVGGDEALEPQSFILGWEQQGK